ncbi:hypothetical protein TRFO_16206 [Tritrichomonas foetus]|uniref:Protein kinase domain-containing protein n=1 Tax=Tritrichomonas foetus TaxID=1144522 RepID=A0A1J4KV74_9EUKA|nr:hypothetical protein TRFO_16206 [Tritrichomonas foetus]|eukprot:OHT13644.1 hypothetical protein TRFO_16206 [Tritrichomonas foetus]
MDDLKQQYPDLIVSLSNYTIDYSISKNLHSTVYAATENSTKKQVIVKQFNSKILDYSFAVSFALEAYVSLKVESPFVVKTIGFTDVPPYSIIQVYQANKSLSDVLYKSPFYLTPSHKTLIAMCLAHVMSKLHKQSIVLRNFAPQHILIDQYLLPHVSSFGSSQLAEGNCVREAFDFKYIAPEFLSGSTYSEKVDVYSYGMILYEMLTGKPPYDGLSPVEVQCNVSLNEPILPEIPSNTPEPLHDLILACWRKDYSKRPSFNEIYQKFVSKEVHYEGFDSTTIDSVIRSIDNNVEVVIPPWATKTNFKLKTTSLFENVNHIYESFVSRASDKLTDLFLCANSTNVESFYGVLWNIIEKDVDVHTIETVVNSTLHLMSQDPCFFDHFIRNKLYEKLPLSKTHALNEILSLLIPVFQVNPKLASPKLLKELASKVQYCPLKVLRVLVTICNRFSNEWINWQVIDILLTNAKIFLNCKAGAPFLYTFYRLIATYETVRVERGPIYARLVKYAIDSPDIRTVKAAYPILTSLNMNAIKAKCLTDHLLDTNVQQLALNYLCTFPVSLIDTNILKALCNIPNSPLAASLLIKFAQDVEITQRLLTLGSFLKNVEPKYLIKILMEMMISKQNRSQIMALAELPYMLTRIALVGDRKIMDAVCKMMRRLPVNADFVKRLSEASFIQTYIQQAIKVDLFETHVSCFLLLDPIAHHAFVPEYLTYLDTAIGLLVRAPQLSLYVLTYLVLMSSSEEGAKVIANVPKIDQIIQQYRAEPQYKNLADSMMSNIQYFTKGAH